MNNLDNFYYLIQLSNSILKLDDDKHILRKFNLEEFVYVYIDEANQISKLRLHCDKFDKRIRQNVASKLKIRREVVRYLEHPFYWEFLCYNQPKFKFVNPFRTFIESSDTDKYSIKILEKYGLYFKPRLCNLCISN